jgi:hypothetical protein
MYDMGPTALLPLRRKCVLGIFITHKNPPSSVWFEPATECPVGPVASTLTTRPPKAVVLSHILRLSIITSESALFWKNHLLVCDVSSDWNMSFCSAFIGLVQRCEYIIVAEPSRLFAVSCDCISEYYSGYLLIITFNIPIGNYGQKRKKNILTLMKLKV